MPIGLKPPPTGTGSDLPWQSVSQILNNIWTSAKQRWQIILRSVYNGMLFLSECPL